MKKILGFGSLLLGSGWLLTQLYILFISWKGMEFEDKLLMGISSILPVCMIALGFKWLKQSKKLTVDDDFYY